MWLETRNSLRIRLFALCLIVAVSAMHELSALELNRYFSNDMVLQRDKPVNVWGTAKAGDTVTVSFAGQTAKTTERGHSS